MNRISTPENITDAPEAAHPVLEQVKKAIGVVPNLYRLTSNSPSALEGLVNFNGALGKGALNAATRERIALAIANYNGCDYCNSAHTYLGKNLAKLDDAEIEANRAGGSTDAFADAAVKFSISVAKGRGRVDDEAFDAVRAAGYSDAEIVEIVGHVALNIYTNYLNEVFGTEVDFPVHKANRAD